MNKAYHILSYIVLLSFCSACATSTITPSPSDLPTPSTTASPVATPTPLPTATATPAPTATMQANNPLPSQEIVQNPQLPIGASQQPFAVVPSKQIQRAQADLAQRLNIEADQITTQSAWAITWPNQALGCPRSNQAYPDQATEGVLITLLVDNTPYIYHGDRNNPPFLCEYR
jgi:hypothetical protein